MSRADRWWRPTNRRPAVRARSRMYRYNEYDVNLAYDRGVLRGTEDTAERTKRRDDLIFRLARAAEEGPESMEELARELDEEAADDLLDVADAAGVSPIGDTDPEQLVDELERWLRDREGDG